MVKRVTASKKSGAPARGKKKSSGFKGRPAPAPAPRRKKGGGKRSFRKFSVKDPFRGKGSDGADVDASPFELSMHSVRLSKKEKVLGMDDTRRKTQRKLIWYWQFSRNWQVTKAWNWRLITEALSVAPEKHQPTNDTNDANDSEDRDWIWFWRWRDWQNKMKRRRKRNKGSLLLSPKRVRLIGIAGDGSDGIPEDLLHARHSLHDKHDESPGQRTAPKAADSLAQLLSDSKKNTVTRRVGIQIDSPNYNVH
jgi:hypothetical protein